MIWGIADVMQYTGLSRKAVTHLLNSKTAPVLPRKKNEKFRIPKEAFIKWFNGGSYEK